MKSETKNRSDGKRQGGRDENWRQKEPAGDTIRTSRQMNGQ